MSKELSPKYMKRIEEIDKKIEEIRNNQEIWKNEGGVGPRKALAANAEIDNLLAEKKAILNGTQEKIDNIKEMRSIMIGLKKRSKSLKRKREFKKEIQELDLEAEQLRRTK